MALLFGDGFDNYTRILDFWDSAGNDCSIRVNTGAARTGTSCLQINSAAFGPTKSIVHVQDLLACTAWNSDTAGPVISFLNTDADVGFNSTVLWIAVLSDGNIQVFRHPEGGGSELGRTHTPGLVQFNQYVSIAMRVFCSPTVGRVTVWVNGVQVLLLTGVDTTFLTRPDLLYYNGVQLMAPGGLPNTFHDDVYFLDCGTPPNDNFLGALKLYALPPTANHSVQWTPLANQNWQEVAENPPDGDTSYVSSNVVGQKDQYVYPLTGVPANSSILWIQHELDMEVDSGSRSVSSDVSDVVNANPISLSNAYHIYPFPYDTKPGGGSAWAPGDFPVNAGPAVTA